MFDLIVAGAVAYAAWYGSKAGPVRMTIQALELTVAVIAGLLLHEPLANLLLLAFEQVEPFLPSDLPYQMIAVAGAFVLIAGGGYGLIRVQYHAKDPPVLTEGSSDEDEEQPALLDRALGAASGMAFGIVACGAVFVGLSMLPVPSLLRVNPQAMTFDVGGMVLRMAGAFEPDWHEGKSLIVYGEPASTASDAMALLANEPWFDVDEDGQLGDADRFSDSDENGAYSKDLYFADLDGDGMRRIGLYEKFAAGRWDLYLISSTRERPDLKKPALPETEAGGEQAAQVPRQPNPEPQKPLPPTVPPPVAPLVRPEPEKPKPADDSDF
jgi:hypothetical protein